MKLAVFPKYQDLFPGHEVPTLDEVLAKTSSKTLLKVFSFMNAQVHLHSDDLAFQERIFKRWIDVFPEEVRDAITKHYLAFKYTIMKEGHVVTLFAPSALLRLIQYIILHFNDVPEKPSKDADDEMVLLEAWLINNSTFDLEVAEGTKPEVSNLLGVMLVNQSTQYEFIQPKDFVYQTLLAHAFFKFLAGNIVLEIHLQEFLNYRKLVDYNQYFQHLISVYANGYQANSFGVQVDKGDLPTIGFFDSLAYDLAQNPFANLSQQVDPDYMLLRERPLIKDVQGGYYPVHHNFFVDKLYQGLLFDFYQNTSIKKLYKDFGRFLQFLGQEFAETHLFYDYLRGCFLPKKYLTAVAGNLYKDAEYSDYYVREGNSLFLFEFKNSVVSAQIKHSKDFAKIKSEIIKKLVLTDNNQPKGAGQLLNVIHKVATGGFHFDDLNAKRIGRLHIYPIVVYTDDFFSLDGVQTIVSEEFKQLLIGRPIKRHQVNDVTLMHLKDIIDIHFLVQSGKITFLKIMQEYFAKRRRIQHKKPRNPQELLDRFVCFRPLVQHMVKPYGNQQDLLNRMSTALGLEP